MEANDRHRRERARSQVCSRHRHPRIQPDTRFRQAFPLWRLPSVAPDRGYGNDSSQRIGGPDRFLVSQRMGGPDCFFVKNAAAFLRTAELEASRR